ncbi:MAG: PilZ domain-containing protein [Methyloprofundus sp.]|nr:PilZ domain-containing protein [Methyloprofundus sp.]
MNLESKRNHYQKRLTKLQAVLTHEDSQWPCEIIDMSLHGCLLRFKHTWEQQNIESLYTLTIQAPEISAIIMNLSISHVIDNEAGFKCEHIDIDKSALLQHLLGEDSDSNKLLARELIELTHPV